SRSVGWLPPPPMTVVPPTIRSPRGRASARVVPVSIHLPASGTGTRSLDGIRRPRITRNIIFEVMQTAFRGVLRPKISTLASSDKPVIPTAHRIGRCTLPSTPSPQCRPQISISAAFMHKASQSVYGITRKVGGEHFAVAVHYPLHGLSMKHDRNRFTM